MRKVKETSLLISDSQKVNIRRLAQLFKSFSGSFAKWRWGTLYTVVASQIAIMPGVIMLSSLYTDVRDEIGIKDGELWTALEYCANSPDYRRKAKLLFVIATWTARIVVRVAQLSAPRRVR